MSHALICSFFPLTFVLSNHLTNICLWFQVALVAINVLGDSVDGNAFNTIVSEHSPSPVARHCTYTSTAAGGAVVLWFCETMLCKQSLWTGLTDFSSSIHWHYDSLNLWHVKQDRSEYCPHILYHIYLFIYVHHMSIMALNNVNDCHRDFDST